MTWAVVGLSFGDWVAWLLVYPDSFDAPWASFGNPARAYHLGDLWFWRQRADRDVTLRIAADITSTPPRSNRPVVRTRGGTIYSASSQSAALMGITIERIR